jgi:hypothetical protein
MVVYAVEGYSRLHHISEAESLALFEKYHVTDDIRACYDTLHTQDFEETLLFAEDNLKAKQK